MGELAAVFVAVTLSITVINTQKGRTWDVIVTLFLFALTVWWQVSARRRAERATQRLQETLDGELGRLANEVLANRSQVRAVLVRFWETEYPDQELPPELAYGDEPPPPPEVRE